jgi:hypothetical protein
MNDEAIRAAAMTAAKKIEAAQDALGRPIHRDAIYVTIFNAIREAAAKAE